jgi:predicted transcriptional regulator
LLLDRGAADDAAQSRIRDLLQHHDRIMVIASTGSTDTQNDPERRIFQAFAPIQLPKIGPGGMMAELGLMSAEARANAGAAAVLFGGTPEHAWSFARIVRLAPGLPARDQFHALVDIESAQLLRGLDTLPLRSRRLVDALIAGGEPARPTEIAKRLDARNSDIGQTIKELLTSGLIALHPGSSPRKRLYFLRDRLLADCYRRASGANDTDLADVLSVVSQHLLSSSGKLSAWHSRVAADLARIRSTLKEKGRPPAYVLAAELLSSQSDDYFDVLTAQLVKLPLDDAILQGDLANLANAKTSRGTHGAILRAASRSNDDSANRRHACAAIDIEAAVGLIRSGIV